MKSINTFLDSELNGEEPFHIHLLILKLKKSLCHEYYKNLQTLLAGINETPKKPLACFNETFETVGNI
jgi:hypothetical protein